MEAEWAASPQVHESARSGFPCGQAQQQMGNGYLLHPHQAGRIVHVHDTGPLRQQHCCLQDLYRAEVNLVHTIHLAMRSDKKRAAA